MDSLRRNGFVFMFLGALALIVSFCMVSAKSQAASLPAGLKARQTEKIEDQKEAAEKEKRLAEEAKKEKLKQKQLAKERIKAQKKRDAEFKKMYNDAKKLSDAKIKDAKKARNQKLDVVTQKQKDLKANKQLDDYQKQQIASEKAKIESDYDLFVAKEQLRLNMIKQQSIIQDITLPEDNSPTLEVKNIQFVNNLLISTEEIIKNIPIVYNASAEPILTADSQYLYDFRPVEKVILNPDQTQNISSRTIQGFTQYVLSRYQQKNYAGVYVYVPRDSVLQDNILKNDTLVVKVLEAPITDVSVKSYDPNQQPTEKGFLKKSLVLEWSPLKENEVANQKKLDDYVNLLNENPDRYVSAVVTKGSEPNSLAVNYDVYEANPWHWFVQLDNAGTKDKQWVPRVGLINTNLIGNDDILTVIYQAPWEKGIEDEYSVYGSYDVPLYSQKLRLKTYAGYSQYDVNPETGLYNFNGNGSFVGSILTYNLLQHDGWFLDVLGSVEHVRSKVGTDILGFTANVSDIYFNLLGWGVKAHRSDDISDTAIGYEKVYSNSHASSDADFNDSRTNADNDFDIATITASHSQYLDPNEISKFTVTLRHVTSNERLVPAKMSTFGGLYSVRGYEEDEIVADGGTLFSAQYEFDLIKYDQAKENNNNEQAPEMKSDGLELKKLAPLFFFDYGRAKIKHPVSSEDGGRTLSSVGTGALFEIGDNFSGGIYYGVALRGTPDTDIGDDRWNFSFLYRW